MAIFSYNGNLIFTKEIWASTLHKESSMMEVNGVRLVAHYNIK